MHSTTVRSENVQVSGFEKITCFDPSLYGKDYGKYSYLVKLIFRGFTSGRSQKGLEGNKKWP